MTYEIGSSEIDPCFNCPRRTHDLGEVNRAIADGSQPIIQGLEMEIDRLNKLSTGLLARIGRKILRVVTLGRRGADPQELVENLIKIRDDEIPNAGDSVRFFAAQQILNSLLRCPGGPIEFNVDNTKLLMCPMFNSGSHTTLVSIAPPDEQRRE